MIFLLISALASICISAFILASHATEVKIKNLPDQSDFGDLTVDGNLTVGEGGVFKKGLVAYKNVSVVETKSSALITESFLFGDVRVSKQDLSKLNVNTEWFRVNLIPNEKIRYSDELSNLEESIPFGKLINYYNISAQGPIFSDHFILNSDNQSGVNYGNTATFAKFTDATTKSTWLIEGSLNIHCFGFKQSESFSFTASLVGTSLQNKLTDNNSCTTISQLNSETSLVPQMLNFPPAVVTFPLLPPNGTKMCEYVGLNISFDLDGTSTSTTVNVHIDNMEFTFKKLRQIPIE
jgi:hypothetical protein